MNKSKKNSKAKKATKRPAQLLGLKPQKMTPRSCRQRANELLSKVEKGKFKGQLAELAKAWAYKYRSHANRLEAA